MTAKEKIENMLNYTGSGEYRENIADNMVLTRAFQIVGGKAFNYMTFTIYDKNSNTTLRRILVSYSVKEIIAEIRFVVENFYHELAMNAADRKMIEVFGKEC